MSYASFDRTPPPLFKQGSSAFSRFLFFIAFALFLMVADTRFGAANYFRSVLSTALYPVQWLALAPLGAAQYLSHYFSQVHTLQAESEAYKVRLVNANLRGGQFEQLKLENQRLRQLLELRMQAHPTAIAAQVLYDAADPYTRKIIIDKGTLASITIGSPVLDEFGVVGQVTRTHPGTSEVTLLTERDHAIPVLNTRTGARSVAYGDSVSFGGVLELRFMAANADVLVGDVLTTSGIDGVYPPGLPVAKIDKIERRADTAFAKIYCTPIGRVASASHLLVVAPTVIPEINTLDEKATVPMKRGADKGKGGAK